MGRIEYQEAIASARRFEARRREQETVSSPEIEAKMLDRRRDRMLASGRVFFESIIERSDLMPMLSGARSARGAGVGKAASS